MLYYGWGFGTTVLEIKNAVVVLILISIKDNSLCRGLTDSNYFYTEELIPCTNFCVRHLPFVCMLHAQS